MIINHDPMQHRKPKAIKAGWAAMKLFDMLVDISAIHNLGGKIPPEYQDPDFIAREFGFSPTEYQVDVALSRLIEAGVVERLPGDDAHIWIPDWEKIAQDPGAKAPEGRGKKRGGGKYIYNTSIPVTSGDRDRGAGEEKGEGGGEEKGEGTRKAMTLPALKEFWNSRIPPEIPQLYKIHGGQREMLAKARLAEFAMADWEKLVSELHACPFLQGDNDRGWKLNFDWVIQPGKMAKVLEGKYRGLGRSEKFGQNHVRPIQPGEDLYE